MIINNYEILFIKSEQNIEDEDILGYKVSDGMKWVSMIDRLTNGDMTKDDDIYSKSVIDVYNRLAFWAQRDKVMKNRKQR